MVSKLNQNVTNCARVFWRQNKTFCYSKKIWKRTRTKAFGLNFSSTDRKRFVSIQNFVSKTNIFDLFWNKSSKMKAFDLERTLVWHCYCCLPCWAFISCGRIHGGLPHEEGVGEQGNSEFTDPDLGGQLITDPPDPDPLYCCLSCWAFFLVAGFMEGYLMKKGRENKETQNLRIRFQEAILLRIYRIWIHNTAVYLVELIFLLAGFMEGYLMKKGRENKETQNLRIRI